MSDGYDALKVDSLQRDEQGRLNARSDGLLGAAKLRLARERIAALREAVGEDVDIILELHAKTDANSCAQIMDAVGEYGIYYMEEPTAPLNPALMARIRERVSVPLAAGERIYTRYGFRPFLEARSLDVIQPDIANCGGITEGKKICDMVRVYDVVVQPHVCGGPISMAAACHLATAVPNFLIMEYHMGNLSDFYASLCAYDDFEPHGGYIVVPDRPGLGQEVPEEILARCKSWHVG